MTWRASEIAQMCQGKLFGADVVINIINTDSRHTAGNSLFIALVGDKFDAHNFVLDTFKNGAVCAIVNINYYKSLSDEVIKQFSFIVVEDSKRALQTLAQSWIEIWRAAKDDGENQKIVIAISGSNGKTSTKEMLAKILISAFGENKVLYTQGNLNNDIGVPLTIMGLREHHQYAVIEVGINRLGEMQKLAQIVQPNITLITNTARAHLEGFGCLENIALEKSELYKYLQNDGIAIINKNDNGVNIFRDKARNKKIKYINPLQAKIKQQELSLVINCDYLAENININLPTPAYYQAYNVISVLSIVEELKVNSSDIIKTLANFQVNKNAAGRMQIIKSPKFNLINDSYNANPDSMLGAINTLANLAKPRIIIMGDMGEVGVHAQTYHLEIIEAAIKSGIEKVALIGDTFTNVYKNLATDLQNKIFLAKDFVEINLWLQNLAEIKMPAKDSLPTILIKGSRFMAMEKLVKLLVPNQYIGEFH